MKSENGKKERMCTKSDEANLDSHSLCTGIQMGYNNSRKNKTRMEAADYGNQNN